MTHDFKEHYTDDQQLSGHDILNVVNSNNLPTLRKRIDRNCGITLQGQQEGMIRSDLKKIFKDIPEKDLTSDFFRGYSVAENVINQAIHNYFEQVHFINQNDLDVIFFVDDSGRPMFEIDYPEDEDDGDDGEDETPKPDAPTHPQIQKIKEDLDL
jgi:hypothetical protein